MELPELPPLPEPKSHAWNHGRESSTVDYMEHCELMREYARQAVAAERERCARIAESTEAGDGSHDYNAGAGTMSERVAAAIRAQGGGT